MTARDTCLVCCRPITLSREEWSESTCFQHYPFDPYEHEQSGAWALAVVWGVISLALWARKACRGVPRAPDPSCEECKGGGRMIVWFNNTDGDETDCTCTVRR